jgi:hypothetical protein
LYKTPKNLSQAKKQGRILGKQANFVAKQTENALQNDRPLFIMNIVDVVKFATSLKENKGEYYYDLFS